MPQGTIGIRNGDTHITLSKPCIYRDTFVHAHLSPPMESFTLITSQMAFEIAGFTCSPSTPIAISSQRAQGELSSPIPITKSGTTQTQMSCRDNNLDVVELLAVESEARSCIYTSAFFGLPLWFCRRPVQPISRFLPRNLSG